MSLKTVEDIIAALAEELGQEPEDLEQILCEIFAQVADEQRGRTEIEEWEAAGQPAVDK